MTSRAALLRAELAEVEAAEALAEAKAAWPACKECGRPYADARVGTKMKERLADAKAALRAKRTAFRQLREQAAPDG